MPDSRDPRCRLCGAALVFVHGHGACDARGCPLRGQNQAECCTGETAEACPAEAGTTLVASELQKP